ncbi:MAG: NTP transferase domain-containing protein [Planctomycetota bacterium]
MTQTSRKHIVSQTAVVILAGGSGSRMGHADTAKVCFEIGGQPAINRTIQMFKMIGFTRFGVVVGSMAQQVISTIAAENPEVTFFYQGEQLGTGHAAKVAADALQALGHSGPVFLTLGDKFVEKSAIEAVVDGFVRQQADAALLTIPKTTATAASSGRVFVDPEGQVVGIIENPDIRRQQIADELRQLLVNKRRTIPSRLIRGVCSKHIPNEKKLAVAAGELLLAANRREQISKSELQKILGLEKYNLTVASQRYTAGQIERICTMVNPSLYLFTAEAFYRGIAMIDNNNAQNEYYLTDVIKNLAALRDKAGKSLYRLRAVAVNNSDLIQGFNSPGELLAIQDYVRRKKIHRTAHAASDVPRPKLSKNCYCTAAQWIAKIESNSGRVKSWLRRIYGDDPDLHNEKCRDLVKTLNCFTRRFGFEQKVLIVRVPGRINLMGRHIDHRGGFNNILAIDRETTVVASLRSDDKIIAVNTQPAKFPNANFSISGLMGGFEWDDWENFVSSQWVRKLLTNAAGEWSNYIKAAMLRLQHQYRDLRICGANMAFHGNIPIGAGLSSSSTLIVASLQAAIALNNLELTSEQFIDLCGEGEWFIGSRTEAGTHAAMYLGQRGKIAHVGYLPFRVEKIIDALSDCLVIIADSGVKTENAQASQMRNERIACCELGLALIRQNLPRGENIEYVRDIDPQKLGCTTSQIYRMLLKIPVLMTRKAFRQRLSGEHKDLIDENFATHRDPGYYPVRSVLLFSISEIIRSKFAVDYLQNGNLTEFGRLIQASHNGDRIVIQGPDGRYRPFEPDCDDEYLNRLISDLAGEDPQRVLNAQLYMQSGWYGGSSSQTDLMVDAVQSLSGVIGAQIAGAGLGGCIMILARNDTFNAVKQKLKQSYYKPNNLKPIVIPCRTVEGAGLVKF